MKTSKNVKNKTKVQVLEMMKLAITNKRVKEIGIFKDILFDPVKGNNEDIILIPGPILSTLLLKSENKQSPYIRLFNKRKKLPYNPGLEN